MAPCGYSCLRFPPATLSSAGIDKLITPVWRLGVLCLKHLVLGSLTCSEITQSPAKPTQLSNTALSALTQMSQAVNAVRDCEVAVVCVQLCMAQPVSSKCLCDALEQEKFREKMRHQSNEKTGEGSGSERLPEVNVVVYQWSGSPRQG